MRIFAREKAWWISKENFYRIKLNTLVDLRRNENMTITLTSSGFLPLMKVNYNRQWPKSDLSSWFSKEPKKKKAARAAKWNWLLSGKIKFKQVFDLIMLRVSVLDVGSDTHRFKENSNLNSGFWQPKLSSLEIWVGPNAIRNHSTASQSSLEDELQFMEWPSTWKFPWKWNKFRCWLRVWVDDVCSYFFSRVQSHVDLVWRDFLLCFPFS